MFTDLGAEDRKEVEKWIRLLTRFFSMCQGRFADYGMGTENVQKLLADIYNTRAILDQLRAELIARHQLNRRVQ
jgi:hypothetical protein